MKKRDINLGEFTILQLNRILTLINTQLLISALIITLEVIGIIQKN